MSPPVLPVTLSPQGQLSVGAGEGQGVTPGGALTRRETSVQSGKEGSPVPLPGVCLGHLVSILFAGLYFPSTVILSPWGAMCW